jgi:[ribosomal protein S5]-alanine N-acetyltransferase
MSAGGTDYFDTPAALKQNPMPDTKSFEWGSRLPTLRTPRLALRSLEVSDDADVFAVFSDPMVMRYWDGATMTTREDALNYIDHIHLGFRRRELFQWGIADRETNAIVGTCTLTHVSPNHERAEIGFAIRQERWGQGLGSEAVEAVVAFGFESLNLHRIEADVDPRNERSLRLLERLGFRREGHLRERYYISGERQDAVMMGLLRPDWKPRHP